VKFLGNSWKHFGQIFEHSLDAVGKCSGKCSYQSFGIKVHLIRKVVSEYHSFKRQFPEGAAKITSFGKDNCRFEQKDVHEKFPQMGISI